MEFTEQLRETPQGLDIAMHVIGILVTVPSAVGALKKPGPKNKAELSRALLKAVSAVAQLITDLPGLERAKPAAGCLAWVVKAGEKICLVPHEQVSEVRPVQ